MLQGFLVALVSALIYLESRLVGQHMLDRPIIIGPVVGLIMGDPVTGLVVGGQLELVWMGLNGIGTTTPPNVVVGSALATALAISTGASYETTLALAVPIAVVAQLCDIAAPIVNTFFAHQADRFADQENYRGIDLCIWGGGIVYFLFKFVPIFLGYVLGSGVITSFVDQIPPVIQEGLNQSGNLLPALGVAMLIQLTWDKKFGVILFLGFALAAFLNVSTLGAAFFGAIAAVVYYMLSGKQAPAAALATQGAASEPIDDEDDEEL